MKKLILLGAVIGLLSSCSSTKSLYSWYDYEDATYQYNKKRTDELKVKMMDQYLKLIQKQKGSRKVVPPGLYAEYGYALYMGGKKEEGLNYLKQEIKLYPESESYISRIINTFADGYCRCVLLVNKDYGRAISGHV